MPIQEIAGRLAENLRQLREKRNLTQVQAAKQAGVPRATWTNLESGGGNPTLSVLHRVAQALQVTVDELVSAPPATTQRYAADSLPVRRPPGGAIVRKLLPDSIRGMAIDRMELPPQARMTGVPHPEGTREYLTCESGQIDLYVSRQKWTLSAGDVVVFRGDQRHSYVNPTARTVVAYSVVVLVLG
jgi:transcriptional regulator with XRE-family HTH domain